LSVNYVLYIATTSRHCTNDVKKATNKQTNQATSENNKHNTTPTYIYTEKCYIKFNTSLSNNDDDKQRECSARTETHDDVDEDAAYHVCCWT